MKDYIKKEFSSILIKIKDHTILERTVNAWVIAAEKGSWTPEEIKKIPFTLLTETEGISLIDHSLAVARGAGGLGHAIENTYPTMPFTINWDILYAGALLHDVGKLTGIEKTNKGYQKIEKSQCTEYHESGAFIASKAGLPEEIINIIANHSKEYKSMPVRIEAILIHHADLAVFYPMVMKAKGLLIEQD